MKCLVCGSFFNEKRKLIDLFRTKKFHVCFNCLSKHPIEIQFNTIPLDNHMLEVVSLFNKDCKINYDAFTFEFSEVYKTISALNRNKQIIFINKLYLNDDILENYSYISTLLDSDIVIVTNFFLI